MNRADVEAMARALSQVGNHGSISEEKDCDTKEKVSKKSKTLSKGPEKNKDVETQVQEGSEEISELSKKTLGNYVKAAQIDVVGHGMDLERGGKDGKKAKKKIGQRYRGVSRATDRLTKESFLDRYKAKLQEDAGQEPMQTVDGPAKSVQPAKEVKQGKESSPTKDTGKLDKKTSPSIVDGVAAINDSKREEKKSTDKASSTQTDNVKESTELNESYNSVNLRHVNNLKKVAAEIFDMADKLHKDHMEAEKAQKRISDAYKAGKEPKESDRVAASKRLYACKYTVRELENARDTLEYKLRDEDSPDHAVESVEAPNPVYEGRFGKPVEPETRQPVSIRDALAMMENKSRDDHYKGATPPQTMDDNWSGEAKKFAEVHKVDDVEVADINKVVDKNKQEVGLSLQRSVNYRHNDQTIGDKKPVGNK
jgi:hypothetical protein